jgi:ribosomal protein L37AE/L43A
MGQHFYPCPICKAPQVVRAQAGEVVNVEACEACRQEYAAREYPAHELEGKEAKGKARA